ncbi:MAG TPA: hypothetical protein VG759_17780 [Candidatus Angelobacter sp.]|jgi:hypothetical protein|nr:hypothetical protein [Candidatus Angelobacter sp.]
MADLIDAAVQRVKNEADWVLAQFPANHKPPQGYLHALGAMAWTMGKVSAPNEGWRKSHGLPVPSGGVEKIAEEAVHWESGICGASEVVLEIVLKRIGYETRQIQVFTPDRASVLTHVHGAGGHTFVEVKYGGAGVNVWRMFDATWGMYWHRNGTFVGDVLSTTEVIQLKPGQIDVTHILSEGYYWTRMTKDLRASSGNGLDWYLWNHLEIWAPRDLLVFKK